MEFPLELKVRIEDTDNEAIFDAPVKQDLGSLAKVWDNGTRFAVYGLLEVKTLLIETKTEVTAV